MATSCAPLPVGKVATTRFDATSMSVAVLSPMFATTTVPAGPAAAALAAALGDDALPPAWVPLAQATATSTTGASVAKRIVIDEYPEAPCSLPPRDSPHRGRCLQPPASGPLA